MVKENGVFTLIDGTTNITTVTLGVGYTILASESFNLTFTGITIEESAAETRQLNEDIPTSHSLTTNVPKDILSIDNLPIGTLIEKDDTFLYIDNTTGTKVLSNTQFTQLVIGVGYTFTIPKGRQLGNVTF
jgi:hypothetical protein